MIRFCSGFVFLAGLSILPSSVSAQTLDYGSTFYIGSTTTNMANIHADAVNDEVVNIIDDRQLEAPSPVASVDLSFTPNPKRTKSNLAHFVSQVRGKSAAEAENLEQMFASADVIGLTGRAMRDVGLDPQNVADVYALWWVIAWSAANGVELTSDAGTYQAVQAQARAAFANTADFANTSEADRQQFAEALMVQAGILDSANDEARGDAANRKIVAQGARKGASEMGLNLDTMVLTREGFRPRDGAALDPSLGEADPQLASSSDTVPSGEGSGNSTTYLAIAVAAGAGLGAAYIAGKAAARKG